MKEKEAHHPILSGYNLSEPGSEAVNLRRIVVVRFHQLPPGCLADFLRCLRTNQVGHSTSFPQLAIPWDPVVAPPLDVPCNEVSWSLVCVGVLEQTLSVRIAHLEIAGWGLLVCCSHHLVHPIVATAREARDKHRSV